MENIVHRMSDLKSPWNCPHGRPSLISLGSFKSIISRIDPPKRVYKFWYFYFIYKIKGQLNILST
jgi:hypothetical protein